MKKLLFLIAIVALFTSCIFNTIEGDKNIVTKEYDLSDFSGVRIATTGNIEYIQDSTLASGLSIELDSNLIEYLDVKVEDGSLYIGNVENTTIEPTKFIIRVNSKNIENISLSGAGNLNINEKITADNLHIKLSGAGNFNINEKIEANDLDIKLSGAGNLKVNKQISTDKFQIKLSGVGNINIKELVAEDLDVKLSGAGNISLNGKATNANFKVSGVGNINADQLECENLQEK